MSRQREARGPTEGAREGEAGEGGAGEVEAGGASVGGSEEVVSGVVED